MSRKQLSYAPLYRNGENDDAELMSKDETIKRCFEGKMMRRYGNNYLQSNTDGGVPVVMVGNPELEILISA